MGTPLFKFLSCAHHVSGNCKFCTILEPPRPILDCFREVTNWGRKGILRLSLKSIFRSTDSEDFRGISVTPVIARAFERTIYNMFNKRDTESRLDANQFAYRTSGSCTKTLIKMQHEISSALDNPRNKAVREVRLFTMDFSKLRLSIMKNKPNETPVVKSYSSFLSDRKQRLV